MEETPWGKKSGLGLTHVWQVVSSLGRRGEWLVNVPRAGEPCKNGL